MTYLYQWYRYSFPWEIVESHLDNDYIYKIKMNLINALILKLFFGVLGFKSASDLAPISFNYHIYIYDLVEIIPIIIGFYFIKTKSTV